TILHLLAAAQEAECDFDLKDIDRLSRVVPQLCKVAPNSPLYHMEDVHRAGGIMGILGEIDRAGLLHNDLPTVHSKTMKEALDKWDIMRNPSEEVVKFYKAGRAGTPALTAVSQRTRWPTLVSDRENGCSRTTDHACAKEGGVAVRYGDIALDGCVVKTAGVYESRLVIQGKANILEGQDDAVK